jgi:hypothetical protein
LPHILHHWSRAYAPQVVKSSAICEIIPDDTSRQVTAMDGLVADRSHFVNETGKVAKAPTARYAAAVGSPNARCGGLGGTSRAALVDVVLMFGVGLIGVQGSSQNSVNKHHVLRSPQPRTPRGAQGARVAVRSHRTPRGAQGARVTVRSHRTPRGAQGARVAVRSHRTLAELITPLGGIVDDVAVDDLTAGRIFKGRPAVFHQEGHLFTAHRIPFALGMKTIPETVGSVRH